MLRETTSGGLCGLVCPSRTSERGGEGDCVKEGVDIQPTTRHSWRGRTGRERDDVEADVDDGRGRIRAGQAGQLRVRRPQAFLCAGECVRAQTPGARASLVRTGPCTAAPCAHMTWRSCPVECLCSEDVCGRKAAQHNMERRRTRKLTRTGIQMRKTRRPTVV